MALTKGANVDTPKVEDNLVDKPVDDVLEAEATVVENEPAAETGKAVATTTAASAPTVGGGGAKAVLNSLAEAGFEGLDLDFSSFTSIVLNDGQFECSNGKVLDSKGFKCRITRTRKKYAFRSNHLEAKDVEVVYSYELTDASRPDSNVAKKIAEWKADGHDMKEVKEYLEVWGTMEDDMGDGEMNQSLVMISIPPTSKGRISGYLATEQMKGHQPSDYITHFYRGEKVTKVDFPYYPWAFKVAV